MCLLGRADRSLDQEHVEWALRPARRGLGELDDVELLGDREQLVLEIEDGQLAAVARSELDDADARPMSALAACSGGHYRPSTLKAGPSSVSENTGPSLHTKKRPSWQWPHRPTPQSICRSSVTQMRSSGMPRSWSTSTVARIIRSGPHTKATVRSHEHSTRSMTWVTTPTLPSHSGPARSTVWATSITPLAASRSSSSVYRRSPGVRAP